MVKLTVENARPPVVEAGIFGHHDKLIAMV